MNNTSSFNVNHKLTDKTKAFLDESGSVAVARYDVCKYPQFDKLTDRQLGFFWRPEEVDLSRDSRDFKELSKNEKHIFTSNLKRQILLDSVQGRSPLFLIPMVSLPEIETWFVTWAFSETIHSRSYTHIIRNVYSNPSKVFDEMMDIKEIVDCAGDISRYYDDAVKPYATDYEKKVALWMCLNSVNALEGVRFYVSFACSWAFAELKKMEGNAKIIKLIARDENLHLASTQTLLKILPKDDPDFAKIKEETQQACVDIFEAVVRQEKEWAKYLFRDGSIIGLNDQLLCEYVEWIAHKRMTSIGLPSKYKSGSNPLPWTQKWIGGSEIQVAPQETEITSYQIGGIKNDVDSSTLSSLSL